METLKNLRIALDTGQFSSEELVRQIYSQLDKGPDYNAFISLTPELALAQARAADQRIANKTQGLLTGLPIGHKDLFCTQGIRTTCASKMLENFISPYNATLVEKLAQAGMCTIGKMNMDEFAMGSFNEYSYFGPVNNPWDSKRAPGGSSGGSAAAVAGGLIPATTGTDTGGSIRQPAALCGITGLKPTYGRVSRFGMIAFASSLDCGGPLARTAEDCAMLLQEMAGFDPRDSTSIQKDVPNYLLHLDHELPKGLKIGRIPAFQNRHLSQHIQGQFDQVFRQFEHLGAEIIDIELPHLDLGLSVYYILAPAEASSNLARFDGIRYGHRVKNAKTLEELYERSRQEGFGEEVQRRIMIGSFVLSSQGYDAYYLQAQKVRRLIAEDFAKAFKQVDAIICPSAPDIAPPIGESKDDPIKAYLSDIFTLPINLAGLPSLALPCGFHQGLPLGFQIIGNAFDEKKLLQLGHQYQQVTDFHLARPKES